jgi:hypothetical protein
VFPGSKGKPKAWRLGDPVTGRIDLTAARPNR